MPKEAQMGFHPPAGEVREVIMNGTPHGVQDCEIMHSVTVVVVKPLMRWGVAKIHPESQSTRIAITSYSPPRQVTE